MANRFLNNITINDEYTLPATDGSANQVIKTDGAGNLSFVDISAVSGITGSGSNTRLAIWSGTSTVTSDSTLTYNTATDVLYVGNAIYGTGDTDTGISWVGGNSLKLVAGGNTRLAVSTAAITASVPTTFVSSIELDGTLIDVNGSAGTSGQILSSTGTGVDWIDSPADNNWYVTGASFNTGDGVLTITGNNAAVGATVDLDGRYLLDTTDTFTGALTINGDIRGNGQQLILNAGEAYSYATGQTDEYVYINAEQGLQINSSPNNWASGWAGRNTTTINDVNGNSTFANDITVSGGDITLGGTGRIQGIDTVSAGTDAVNKNYVDNNFVADTDTLWSFDADGAGTAQSVTVGDNVWFEGLNGITFGSQAGSGGFDHQVSASLDTTGVTAGSYYGSNITVDAYGRISAASNGSLTTVTKFSNIFTLNLNTNNNFLLNASGTYSIAMTITSANIGQSGAIIINNTAATTAGALPSYMLTPEGATLDWVNTSGAVSIISYFVIATDKVLCNYVANFQ